MNIEKIILAALMIDRRVVATSRRHCEIIHTLARGGFKTPIKFEQGFLTSTGRFVDRVEAKEIAITAGQIKETQFSQLYSEDLW